MIRPELLRSGLHARVTKLCKCGVSSIRNMQRRDLHVHAND